MSIRAIMWALEQEVFPSSSKFVLIALANFSSASGKAFPSSGTVCKLCGMHEDTVRSAISKLVADGVIQDTGKRTGTTGQIPVYQLPEAACEPTEVSSRKTGAFNSDKSPGQDPGKPPVKTRVSSRKTGDITGNGERRTAKSFTPPTLDECKAQAKEKGLPEEEGEKFFNHFEASNWIRGGGVKIQKWKSAFATWAINYERFKSTNGNKPKSNGYNFVGKQL